MGKYVLFWVLMQATSCSDALSVLVWSNCYVCISLWQPSLASQQVPLFASRDGHMCRVLHRGLCLLMVWSNQYANHKWAISTFRACFLCSSDYFEVDHLCKFWKFVLALVQLLPTLISEAHSKVHFALKCLLVHNKIHFLLRSWFSASLSDKISNHCFHVWCYKSLNLLCSSETWWQSKTCQSLDSEIWTKWKPLLTKSAD